MSDTWREISDAKQIVLDKMAGVMLHALKKECGVYLTDKEWYELREKLADTLRGQITL